MRLLETKLSLKLLKFSYYINSPSSERLNSRSLYLMQAIFPFELTDIEVMSTWESFGLGLNFVRQSWSVIFAENSHL